jgi:anti-sigma-K factor RskA
MTPEDREPMDSDDLLAMGYALGTLSAEERRVAETRHASDPAFREACDGWAAVLAPLADAVAPVAPSPALWERIEAAVAPDGAVTPAATATAPATAPATVSATAGRRVSLWESLGFWRGATAVSAAAAVAALLVPRAAVPPPAADPVPGALLSATLAPETGGALLTAALDPARRQVVVAPVGAQALEGRVPELWLIPADGRPRSLGLISLGGTQRVAVPETVVALVADGAVLAVSLEPAGGSPTGLPTGPVVATGRLTAL